MEISWKDFEKIDMRIGTVLQVDDFPRAKKAAYQLKVDFGPEIGIKKTSAQITKRYKKEDLLNRQVVAVINFPKKQIADFMSECLILGAVNKEDVILLQPGEKAENGLKIG